MPLIDVTLKPGFTLCQTDGSELVTATRMIIRKEFGPALPELFVRNAEFFRMDGDTPSDGVQVQFHDYDEDDINVADVWVKVQFSEEQVDKSVRVIIRNAVFTAIVDWFDGLGIAVPDNFVLDVFWGPTHGCGSVNGKYIEW